MTKINFKNKPTTTASIKISIPLKTYTIFIGGGGDKYSHLGFGPSYIMKDVWETFNKQPKVKQFPRARRSAYFGFEEEDDILNSIISYNTYFPRGRIHIVGHSYGGSAGVNVANNLSNTGIPITLLITLDPVSRLWSLPKKRPTTIKYWINVNAVLKDLKSADASDGIARLGGNWNHDIEDMINRFDDAHLHHAEAWKMLQHSPRLGRLNAWEMLLEQLDSRFTPDVGINHQETPSTKGMV